MYGLAGCHKVFWKTPGPRFHTLETNLDSSLPPSIAINSVAKHMTSFGCQCFYFSLCWNKFYFMVNLFFPKDFTCQIYVSCSVSPFPFLFPLHLRIEVESFMFLDEYCTRWIEWLCSTKYNISKFYSTLYCVEHLFYHNHKHLS